MTAALAGYVYATGGIVAANYDGRHSRPHLCAPEKSA